MLVMEAAWRASAETQALFGLDEKTGGAREWMDRVQEYQETTLIDAFTPPQLPPEQRQVMRAQLLHAMRTACETFPEHAAEFQGIAVQFRHNRSRRGDLRVLQQAPDVPLVPLTEPAKAAVTLHGLLTAGDGGLPLVVVAGSYT